MSSLQLFIKLNKFKSSLFTLSALCVSVLAAHPSFAIEIPSDLAQIQDELKGTNGKTLILIQEAHVDYGAQKAIAELLRYLVEKESLRLMLVEGGWGDASLTHLRSYGSLEGRLEVAERYLREGKISGGEYLDIVSDLNFSVWGIEDAGLYAENMAAFLKISPELESLKPTIADLKHLLNVLQEKIFTPELNALQSKKNSFEDEKITLIDYLRFLIGLKRGSLEDYPSIAKLASASGLSGGFDIEKVEHEKQKLVQALSRKMTKPEFEKIQLLEARKSPQEELEFLQALLALYRKDAELQKSLPLINLTAYTHALAEAVSMDARNLLSELKNLEEDLSQGLAETEDQRQLLVLSGRMALLEDLFELKLGPEDFEKIEKNIADYRVAGWAEWINSVSEKYGIAVDLPDIQKLDDRIPDAMAFYISARKRETALIDNAVKKATAQGDPIAAVIVGGFHTEKLARAFGEKGYSVLTVSPRFAPSESTAQHQQYFEILKYKWGSGPQVPSSEFKVSNAETIR